MSCLTMMDCTPILITVKTVLKKQIEGPKQGKRMNQFFATTT